MRSAVIILNRNLHLETDLLCESFISQGCKPDDIFVIDAASDHDKLSQYTTWIINDQDVLKNGLRFNRGMNQALLNLHQTMQWSQYDAFFLVTNDTLLQTNETLKKLEQIFTEHPKLGLLTPAAPTWGELSLMDRQSVKYSWFINATAMYLRRSCIDQIKNNRNPTRENFLFDGENFRGYLSDTELACKCYLNDWAVGITSNVLVTENEILLKERSNIIRTEDFDENLRLYVEEGLYWAKRKYGFQSKWDMNRYASLIFQDFLRLNPELKNMQLCKNNTVCLLAAGRGTRMGTFTQMLNKALLPVAGKAAITWIIESFPKGTRFIIPVGHKAHTIKNFLDLAHPTTEFTFVHVDNFDGKGSGPGHSLIQCKDHLNHPFYLIACDTLFSGNLPTISENWLGIAKITNPSEYCTIEQKNGNITRLIDKSQTGSEDAFIGLAAIKDHASFFEGLEKNHRLINDEIQLSNGIECLISFGLKAHQFEWFDTGNLDGYLRANSKFGDESKTEFDFSKPGETIYFQNNEVIKFFADQKITQRRVERAYKNKKCFPEINSQKGGFYSYRFLEGNTLYNTNILDTFPKLIQYLEENLWIKPNLSNTDNKTFQKKCFDFYHDKTRSRLKLYQLNHEERPEISNINGKIIPDVNDLIKKINFEHLCTGIASGFHGDLQFDNIIVTDSFDFKLIDWRQDFGGLTDYGDIYYDFAKLLGGIIIPYNLIKESKIPYHESREAVIIEIIQSPDLCECKYILYNYLVEKNYDITKVCLLTSLIFINMAPLHNQPFSDYLFYLGKDLLYKALNGELL